MKLIPLSRGLYARIDDEDYGLVSQYKWCADKSAGETFYAFHKYIGKRGASSTIRMHALIMATPKGMVTDHIDGNGLNNQKSNLRICSQGQNTCNRGHDKKSVSGYKGVTSHYGGWAVQITAQGTRNCLGTYRSPEEAARVYDAAALKYHGEFARLNFPA